MSPPMTPRCDGCRYWMLRRGAQGLTTAQRTMQFGWVPWVGGRENPDALLIGLCRRFPHLEEKAPADWCGEYVDAAGPLMPPKEGA